MCADTAAGAIGPEKNLTFSGNVKKGPDQAILFTRLTYLFELTLISSYGKIWAAPISNSRMKGTCCEFDADLVFWKFALLAKIQGLDHVPAKCGFFKDKEYPSNHNEFKLYL